MTLKIGIDDAGRGPVIGPMILAGVLIDSKDENKLKELGVKDSKLLSPSKRKFLEEKIKSSVNEFHSEKADPTEIDESPNLNHLEAIKTAMIINKLTKNIKEKVEVIIDCPSINIESWTEFLEKLVEKKELIILKAEHKADLNHPIVSAASILAKERREMEIKNLKLKFGDFGSGYPGDPKTKLFLKENLDDEDKNKVFRHSWSTVKKLKEVKANNSLFQDKYFSKSKNAN